MYNSRRARTGQRTYPAPKVGPANRLHPRRQVLQRRHNSPHRVPNAMLLHNAVVALLRLHDLLVDGPARHAAGEEYGKGGDEGELLELRVAEGGAEDGD